MGQMCNEVERVSSDDIEHHEFAACRWRAFFSGRYPGKAQGVLVMRALRKIYTL